MRFGQWTKNLAPANYPFLDSKKENVKCFLIIHHHLSSNDDEQTVPATMSVHPSEIVNRVAFSN